MKKYSEELLNVAKENEQTIEEYIESSKDSDIEYIANLIEQGYASGVSPSWHISIQEDDEDDESRLEEVSRLVGEGYTSGFYPTFSLEIEKWSWEDYQ